jgi:hypothetical protein
MSHSPTPDTVALVRRLYREDTPTKDIVAATKLSTGTIYRCLDGAFDDGSGIQPAPIARRKTPSGKPAKRGTREALVARIWRTAARQVGDIEDRLKASGLELPERESNGRMLAVIARTLRDLSAFDQANAKRNKEAAKGDDDDAVPRNIDDLRQSLARKLQGLIAEQRAVDSKQVE